MGIGETGWLSVLHSEHKELFDGDPRIRELRAAPRRLGCGSGLGRNSGRVVRLGGAAGSGMVERVICQIVAVQCTQLGGWVDSLGRIGDRVSAIGRWERGVE